MTRGRGRWLQRQCQHQEALAFATEREHGEGGETRSPALDLTCFAPKTHKLVAGIPLKIWHRSGDERNTSKVALFFTFCLAKAPRQRKKEEQYVDPCDAMPFNHCGITMRWGGNQNRSHFAGCPRHKRGPAARPARAL